MNTEDQNKADFPRKSSTGSESGHGYSVEAMSDGDPLKIGDFIASHEWKRVPFVQAIFGVPGFAPYERGVGFVGLLNYPAAQALRWWLHAEAHKDAGWLSLRTRIIKHSYTISHECKAVSAHCEIGGEDRSALVPDWGSKPKQITASSDQERSDA